MMRANNNNGSVWVGTPPVPASAHGVSDPMNAVQSRLSFETMRANQHGWLHANRLRAIRVIALGLFRFTLHLAEIWFAMVLGSMAFAYARHWLAILGNRSFLDPMSLQSEIGHGIFMTTPMVLWMRIRAYGWRENIEMALGMIVPWAVVLTLREFAHLRELPWLSERKAMAAGMLAVMLYNTWAKRFPQLRK